LIGGVVPNQNQHHDVYLQGRKDGNLNLRTSDIPGAQPKQTLKVAGVKKFGFFPTNPEIENLLLKDKYG